MEDLRRELSFKQKLKTWFGEKSIIVLTMGKVGTLSICRSLKNIGFNHVHPHSLIYSYPGTHFLKNLNLNKFQHFKFILKSYLKRIKVFIWLKMSKEIKIITGVRDPFSRYISAFFEQSHYLKLDTRIENEDYIRTKLDIHGNFYSTLEWFDKEINKVFDLDIYSYSFNKELGYTIIKKDKIKILIFRLDKLNNLNKTIQKFIDNDQFELIVENVTKNNTIYNKIKKDYKFDLKRINDAIESKYLNQFYTKSEINELKNKWRIR